VKHAHLRILDLAGRQIRPTIKSSLQIRSACMKPSLPALASCRLS